MSGNAARKPPPPARPAPPVGPGAAVAQRLKTFDALRPGPSGGRQAATAGDPLVRATADMFQVRDSGRGVMVRPNGTYNFVRVTGETQAKAETLVSSKAGHAAIAGGRPVLYAGTARFDNGSLEWWSNYSGTYQPMAAFKGQAGLPEDRFQPWQKLQMGGVGMQRGTFLDRRDPTAPTAPPGPTAATSPEKPGAADPASSPAAAAAAPAPALEKPKPAKTTMAANRAKPSTPAKPTATPAPASSAPAGTSARHPSTASAATPPTPVPQMAVSASVPPMAPPSAAPAQAKRVQAGMAPPPIRWSGMPR